MDLTPYIESLRRDLLQAAALGDENTQRTAAALAGAVEPSARLALMNALSDLAAEITGALDDTTVEVKLDGKDVRIAIEHHDRYGSEEDTDSSYDYRRMRKDGDHPNPDDLKAAMREAGSELSRTTVRLFNDLKSQAESAAVDQGISLNTYISKAVADSVRGVKGGKQHKGQRRGSHNVSGWIQG
ncbi:toxin-antitoxin system HicB family antitoxin [Nakamurella lactea]|uniref:toxin-antitoxin system HicB family antitoxin n=1 Tax=Nakamurella lactea TaxID=459515 RepID=UPI0004234E95|nr:toxin-antitoxin system HicB family antitoxin [Nakamurella lactea]